MSGKIGRSFYELEIYQRYEKISDMLWDAVDSWKERHQRHPGEQMLDAIDSVGANIAEAVGRGHFKEGRNYLWYSRGSLTETQHWIRRSARRGLLQSPMLEQLRSETITLHKQLNSFIRAQTPKPRVEPSTPRDPIQEPRAKSQEPPSRLRERKAMYGRRSVSRA